jgi:hypothetical protein
MKVVDRQTNLLEIVLALRTSGGLARSLDCRQQERNEDADDRDHDQ